MTHHLFTSEMNEGKENFIYLRDRPHCNSIIGTQASTKRRKGNILDSDPKGYSP